MKIRLSADSATAIMFLGLGIFTLIYGAQYPMGTASRMGAGYFPRIIGIGLLVVGALIGMRSFRSVGPTVYLGSLRPLLFVLAGTVSFGLLLEKGGLILAGTVLVFLSRFATNEFKVVEVTILATSVIAAIILIFTYALGIRIPIIPRW